MDRERFIRPDLSGRRRTQWSMRGRLAEAVGELLERRRQRRLSHEGGHRSELCYPGEKDGHFQLPPEIEEGGLVDPMSEYMPNGEDTEIVLFDHERTGISDKSD